jgi:arylsulfatase A-like enzyme
MGDPNAHTPNIDRLAAEGLNFTHAVSGFPLCCPARGTLLTSRYAHDCVPGHQRQLPPDYPTIADVFRSEGYHTAYIGKWHLDGFQESEGRAAMHIVPPERRGHFDHWVGYENNNSQWDCWVHGGEGESAFHYRLPGYETDALTDIFIDHLSQQVQTNPTQPFFAALSVQPPHDPYVAASEYMAPYTPGTIQLRPNVPQVAHVVERARLDLAGYYAMIANLDWNVGRIRDALMEMGVAHHTHILFFSDHGDLHGSHGQFRKTSPLEESLRVPLIIGGHVPRYENKSGRTTAPISLIDIAPTTLGLCGIDAPDWMRGTDYSGYRLHQRTPANEPDSAYLQSVIPTPHQDCVDRPWRGIVTRDGWKYVVIEGQPWLLFNLNEDPYEQVNLAFNIKYADQRKRLQSRLAQWIEETGDQFQLPQI